MGGWKESNTWLQARYSARRALRHGKYLVGHDPIFLPILLRMTPMGISKQITDLTDIVVEGFPRSGNTFTVFALQNAAHNQLRIASHIHHPSQVKLAAQRGVPTVLVVREPVSVLASYLTYGQHGRPAGVFKEYASYYRELIPWVDQVLVCDFEELDAGMSSLVARINHRFSMDIPPFDESPSNVDHVFGEIARQHRLLHPQLDPARVAPRPTDARRELIDKYRSELLDPRNDVLRARAEEIYEYFASKAEEQRALFHKIRPKRTVAATRTPRPVESVVSGEELRQSNG